MLMDGQTDARTFQQFGFRGYVLLLWNYQTLLLVDKQVNGQNLLVQLRYTCPKIYFYIFLDENTRCGYSLELPW